MQITNEIIESYFDCNYKAYLIAKEVKGRYHDLEKYYSTRIDNLRNTYKDKVKGKNIKHKGNEISYDILSKGYDCILDVKFTTKEICLKCDFLIKTDRSSKLGGFSYIPIICCENEKNIPRKLKVLLAGIAHTLNTIQESHISNGKILYGNTNTSTINSENYIKEYHQIIKSIRANKTPILYLNKECNLCKYFKYCREKAIKEDNLSLLNGIPKVRINNLNNKGIFTINQLSYTFRPRRKPASINGRKFISRSFPLQALSIRENKIHVLDNPEIRDTKVKYFLDIEGIPNRNFNYLFGLIKVIDENIVDQQYFWIEDKKDEAEIIKQFVETVELKEEFTLYHYGNYEIQAFKYILKQYPQLREILDIIIKNSFNILTLMYNKIYFPTFSNSLKDIGHFIKFKWSHPKASGLQSIFWRIKWEKQKCQETKQNLITYNNEDCLALYRVFLVIKSIINKDGNIIDRKKLKIENANKIENKLDHQFLANATIIPEMRAINKCSYFDYQKEKVFARTNKQLKKNIESNKSKHISHYLIKPDSILEIQPKCPHCLKISTKQVKCLSKTIADLNFDNNGVQRNITLYRSGKYHCYGCNVIFSPQEYPELKLRIGHNLIAWTVYQNIVMQMSFRKIETNLTELFDLYISRATLFMCKQYFIDRYDSTYKEIERKVFSKEVLYVDETPFIMQFEEGYVWVFTNNEEVVSYYKPSREGGFLFELLKEYKGVLVTDFYQAYDKIECPQQKCLIHLIRDMNADLVKNPFNLEFKKITKTFTELIQKIVLTIDKHGLQQQYLEKYIDKSEKFLDSIIDKEFKTEVANHYKHRFKRYKNNLFEFLKHDSVSWHNGNAEHAIRLLAIHTNKNMTVFRKSQIDNYLKIFSIFQTCDFNNISFLKFMLSKETSVYEYIKKAANIK